MGVVVTLDLEDYVSVVLLAALHLAENDILYANLVGLLLEMHPVIRCYSLDGMKSARVVRASWMKQQLVHLRLKVVDLQFALICDISCMTQSLILLPTAKRY